MAQLKVFISHSRADNAFCGALVLALRGAGADVWYDEQNLGAGQLLDEITRELRARPIFIVILSPTAFASKWVPRECKWAYNLYNRQPNRLILPVTAQPITASDFDTVLWLEDFRRIEADYQPLPQADAIGQTLRLLTLTPAGEHPIPTIPHLTESIEDLLAQGKALAAQKKYAEALPFFERATHRAPNNANIWHNLAYILDDMDRPKEAFIAYERTLMLAPNNAAAWSNKSVALGHMGRNEDVLVAAEQALTLDPNYAAAWNNKAMALCNLRRYDEAIAAADRALALDPSDAYTWDTKGQILYAQLHDDDALLCFNRALALDPNDADIWHSKALALRALRRVEEADTAEQKAKELGWSG